MKCVSCVQKWIGQNMSRFKQHLISHKEFATELEQLNQALRVTAIAIALIIAISLIGLI